MLCAMRTSTAILRSSAAAAAVLVIVAVVHGEDEAAKPWFTDVAAEAGVSGVTGKDPALADLDGDGLWDLTLDRERFFRNLGGLRFEVMKATGLEPTDIHFVPLDKEGKPDTAKAADRPYVPHYLYFADLDNDGDTDAVAGMKPHWEVWDGAKFVRVAECDHGRRSRASLNDGKGHFTRGKDSPFSSDAAVGPAMALAIVDTDLDGVLDLYEGREYRQYGVLEDCGVDRLWKGDGKGGFTDVTEAAGLMTLPTPGGPRSSRPSYGVTHADVNGDGYPDLLELAYGRQWNYLWLGGKDHRFTEAGRSSGFAGDGITHGKYPDWLKERAQQQGQERPDELPFRSNGNTFDCAVADYDNDGDLDLFLGEITHFWAGESSDMPSLLVNESKDGVLSFRRVPVTELLPKRTFRGEAWNYGDLHAGWLDFDNDTLQDLLIASGDYPDGQFLRLYRQREDHTFEEVTEQAGFAWEGCGGLSLGDVDRDGDVDVVVGRSFMRLNKAHRDEHMGGIEVPQVGLFRNDVGNRNHWLNVRVRGQGAGHANRAGIGARIEVVTGDVTQLREIRCGAGLSNHQDPPEACFGLGAATKIDLVRVHWPDAAHSVQEFRDVPADRFVTLIQGEPAPGVEKR